MKPEKFLITVILILISYSAVFSQTTYNFNDGLKAAKTSGKKIFINIYSESDNWSKKSETEVLPSAKVQAALLNFIYIKINAEGKEKISYNNKESMPSDLCKILGATGFPTFIFMSPDGSIIRFKYNGEEEGFLSGFLSEDDLVAMLNFFLMDKYKNTDLSSIFNN